MPTHGQYDSGWHRFSSEVTGSFWPGDFNLVDRANLLNANGEAYGTGTANSGDNSGRVYLLGWTGDGSIPSEAVVRAIKLRADFKGTAGTYTGRLTLYNVFEGEYLGYFGENFDLVDPDGNWSNQIETPYYLESHPLHTDWINAMAAGAPDSGMEVGFHFTHDAGGPSDSETLTVRNVEALIEYDLSSVGNFGLLLGAF